MAYLEVDDDDDDDDYILHNLCSGLTNSKEQGS
jgi:hypothetical protein